MFLQLKPWGQSFLQLARDFTRRCSGIVLCEGKSDAEAIKVAAEVLGFKFRGTLAITDCGGVSGVREVAEYVAVLAHVSRKLKVISVVIDADECSLAERAYSIISSLKARGVDVEGFSEIHEGVFKGNLPAASLVVCVLGLMELPFRRHCLEDHFVKVLLIDGKLRESDLERFESSKEAFKGSFPQEGCQRGQQ